MIKQVVHTVIALFILAATLYTSAAAAHGNVTMEEDSCMRSIGESLIHLSAYQPQNDIEGHYCTEIPQTGETIIVVDLVDPSLRNMPISVKVYQGQNNTEGQPILDLPPHYYDDGVISTSVSLLESGPYSVAITAEGIPPLHYQYQLRVEMINYANVFRASIGPVVGLLIITLIIVKLIRSKRFRNWRAARRQRKD